MVYLLADRLYSKNYSIMHYSQNSLKIGKKKRFSIHREKKNTREYMVKLKCSKQHLILTFSMILFSGPKE